jgi:hypothetical protein
MIHISGRIAVRRMKALLVGVTSLVILTPVGVVMGSRACDVLLRPFQYSETRLRRET